FEEFTFRFFAIPFLKKIFRRTFPAVLLPALIWGFLHSSYPQEPGWVRGIEVGAIGIAAGYVMLRFGILATLVWHYTVDAFLIGFFLLKSGSTYLVVSGVFVTAVLLVPLFIALTYVIRTRTFRTEEGLTNNDIDTQIAERAAPAPPPAPIPPPDVTWQAPRWNKSRWMLWAVLTSLSILILIAVPLTRIGDDIRWKINPENAKEIARAFLSRQNIQTDGWRCVVDAPDEELSGSPIRYLSREAGSAEANRFVKNLSLARFDVHFFKPLQKEMMLVEVNAEGDVIGLSHVLDEKAPGDSLTQDSARIVAEAFLTRELGFDTAGFYLLSSSTTARDARIDHYFTYQTDRDTVGAARFRIHANVLGNQPSGGGLYLHVPEEWERNDAEETALRTLSRFLILSLWGALIVLLIVSLIVGVRSGDIKWRTGVTLSFLVGFLSILSLWSRWPSLVAQLYDTSKPFGSWTTSTLAVSVASILILSLLVFTIVPLMRRQFEQTLARPYSFSGWATAEDIHVQRQSIAGAILAVVAVAAFSQFLGWLTLSIGLPTRNAPALWIGYAAERWPFINLLLSALVKAIFGTAIMGFILLWLWPRVKNWILRVAVIVLIPLLFALEEGHGAPEILGEWIHVFGVLLLVIVLLKYYLQQSPMMLFAAIWLGIAIPDSLLWLRQESGFYTLQGALAMVAVIVPLFLWRRFSSRPATIITSKITGE
ncbi:CPBP family intramembrane metalloprotease, partial [bacterium]|nr:CPBP family intramembrane metalloprotease [bacterium]